MVESFKTVTFDWLCQSDAQPTIIVPQSATAKIDYPLDPALGASGAEIIEVDDASFFIDAFHKLSAQPKEQLFPLARVEIAFPEKVFQVQSFRGGICKHKEHSINRDIWFGEDLNLFRLTDAIETTPFLNSANETYMSALNIHVTRLNLLLGEDLASELTASIGIGKHTPIACKRIPGFITSSLLKRPSKSVGATRKLFLQAAILEYLGMLCDFACIEQSYDRNEDRSAREVAHAVIASIEKNPQNPPSLTDLCGLYGKSARKLNAIFVAEFGETIPSFTNKCRMKAAYMLTIETNLPLKHISEMLSYSHVNHFNRAFHNYFKTTPGSLRKSRR